MPRRHGDDEERVGSSWIQNMPDWKCAGIWHGILNFLLLGASCTMVAYSEGVLQNDTAVSASYGDDFNFQSFGTTAMTAFAVSALVTAVLGLAVTAIVDRLNQARQRPSPRRVRCDIGYDVVLMVYLVMLVGCLLAAGIAASFCTYLHMTSTDVPADCPGAFGFDTAPDAGCAFDSTMYIVVNGAVGSQQLADVWAAMQAELDCCGYYCPSANNSAADCVNGDDVWQMESCYKDVTPSTEQCRSKTIHAANTEAYLPMVVGWIIFVILTFYVAFSCRTRVHITAELSKWLTD